MADSTRLVLAVVQMYSIGQTMLPDSGGVQEGLALQALTTTHAISFDLTHGELGGR